jgi:bacterioferritin-associated ferredoxin
MKIAVCATCGSDDVLSDAYAAWATTSQSWELAQTFDKGAYCGKCDGETRIEFKPIPKAQQAQL